MAFPLTLVPFAGVRDADLRNLAQDLQSLNADIEVRRELPIPAEAYDARRGQYRATILLERLRKLADGVVLGLTEAEIYAGNLNFVFGLAECPGRAAVISLHRLRADGAQAALRSRAVKEAVHELGHTFGLQHCPDPACVMHFSNGLADTDRKHKEFCIRCAKAIRHRL